MIPRRQFGLVLLAGVVAVIQAQSNFPGFMQKVGIICAPEDTYSCMAGGIFNQGGLFRGTYICREQTSFFVFRRNVTRCLPTIANGVLGELGDTCGCCGGVCPSACDCYCNNYDTPHVLLYKKLLFGYEHVCVSQGKASRWIADERNANYTCVPPDECPTIAPTFFPTIAPTKQPVYGGMRTSNPVYTTPDSDGGTRTTQPIYGENDAPTAPSIAPQDDGRRLRGNNNHGDELNELKNVDIDELHELQAEMLMLEADMDELDAEMEEMEEGAFQQDDFLLELGI